MTFLQNEVAESRGQMEEGILSSEARAFLSKLAARFEPRRQELLARRRTVQQDIDNGKLPDCVTETDGIRQSDWRVAPIRRDLRDRRVEITGPVDRKMIINALNSGANVFMADFEDSNSPTWNNNIEGQHNLRDAVRGTIRYESPEGRRYQVGSNPATLLVRPRGWHLDEKHFLADGKPISASLFDFGLFFFHNAAALLSKGTVPYFYLRKMERHFLSSYVELLIQTCHRRGIHAMGGMAAEIPIRNDAAANEQALEKVRRDKLREVKAGHDGTWVAHPGLVPVAKEIFDKYMPEPNQISPNQKSAPPPSRTVQAQDLLEVPTGDITDAELRWNIDVGLQYLHSWLWGSGCVPIYNLMEDAATAEICRAQVWQWVKHSAHLKDGRLVTEDMVKEILRQRAGELGAELGAKASNDEKLRQAAGVLEELTTSREFAEFLTLASYDLF